MMRFKYFFSILRYLIHFRFKELRNVPLIKDSILLARIWERKQQTLITSLLFLVLSFVINILIMVGFEHLSFQESIWFTFVTVSTVGYGDYYPSTLLGRIFVIYFILMGITTFTIVIGELINIANIRTEKRRRGMLTYNNNKHIIAICPDGADIDFIKGVCNGLRQRMKDKLNLVIVSPEWQELPNELSEFDAHFIFGSLEQSDTLEKKANIHGAASVLVFPGDGGDFYTANMGQNLKRLNYRVRRIAFASTKSKYLSAYDEIIIPADVSSAIAAESVLGLGGRIVDDLLHPEEGSHIESISSEIFTGKSYFNVKSLFLSLNESVTVLGFTRRGKVFNNPNGVEKIEASDQLNLIVEKNFNWAESIREIKKLTNKLTNVREKSI